MRYLVVESNPLIAEDLSEILAHHAGTQNVVCCRTMAEAALRIDDLPGLAAAFLNVPTDAFRASDLHRRLAEIGCAVVMLSGDPDIDNDDWIQVPRPYTSAMIDAVVDTLRGAGSAGSVDRRRDQADRVSVDAKNIAWLTADRTCSSM